jgi:hypothetical protein
VWGVIIVPDFRDFNRGIVPNCARIFKASASRIRGHLHSIISGIIEILSVVKPGPQAIVVNEFKSIRCVTLSLTHPTQ